ncbi:MAG: right-handed parallel beta-helix repeat-containing protein, partial [Planctomycetes bacterium]|nr:right-handed parallel beta-helix repeat-containing protein [Planctomycetota bacterium]
NSSPTVTNCSFSGLAESGAGGGMLNGSYTNPTTNCTFSGNSASDGGGMYNYENSPTVSNCTFSGNSAENEGGGVSNLESNPTFTGCEFTGNTALGGGGICNENSNPTLTDCEFTGNAATYRGGGVYRGNVTVTDCTFTGNLAGGGGGGMDVDISTVANCAFVANSAEYGGGICGSSDITNCTFVGNSAEIAGGGTYGSSNITNCTLVANSADIGGGVYSSGSVFTGNVLVNCIIWGNIAFSNNEVYSSDGKYTSRALISFCNIKGSGGSGAVWDESLGFDEGGNIDVDPMFIDADGADNITGTEDDDLHLLPYSPCVNTGSNDAASLPTTDFEGDSRIIHDIVDMGVDESVDQMFFLHVTSQPSARACTVTFDPTEYAYLPGTEVTITVDGEGGYIFDHLSGDLADDNNQVTITMDSHKYVTAHFAIDSDIIYVDKSATGFNNGTSWENALNEFYEALITAGEPNEIWVAAGIYKPGYDYGLAMGERGKHFRMLNNVEMYGGFPAGGSDFAGRDYDLYRTILSGDLLGNDDPTIPYDDPTIPDEQ